MADDTDTDAAPDTGAPAAAPATTPAAPAGLQASPDEMSQLAGAIPTGAAPAAPTAAGSQDPDMQQAMLRLMGYNQDQHGEPDDFIGGLIHHIIPALHAGLSSIMQTFGFGGANTSGAIPTPSSTPANTQGLSSNQGAMPIDQYQQALASADPTGGKMPLPLAQTLALQQLYQQKQAAGDVTGASSAAEAFLLRSRAMSMQFGQQAAQQLQSGNYQGALGALAKARNCTPDGCNASVVYNDTTKGATVILRNALTNEEIGRQQFTPQGVAGLINHAASGDLLIQQAISTAQAGGTYEKADKAAKGPSAAEQKAAQDSKDRQAFLGGGALPAPGATPAPAPAPAPAPDATPPGNGLLAPTPGQAVANPAAPPQGPSDLAGKGVMNIINSGQQYAGDPRTLTSVPPTNIMTPQELAVYKSNPTVAKDVDNRWSSWVTAQQSQQTAREAKATADATAQTAASKPPNPGDAEKRHSLITSEVTTNAPDADPATKSGMANVAEHIVRQQSASAFDAVNFTNSVRKAVAANPDAAVYTQSKPDDKGLITISYRVGPNTRTLKTDQAGANAIDDFHSNQVEAAAKSRTDALAAKSRSDQIWSGVSDMLPVAGHIATGVANSIPIVGPALSAGIMGAKVLAGPARAIALDGYDRATSALGLKK